MSGLFTCCLITVAINRKSCPLVDHSPRVVYAGWLVDDHPSRWSTVVDLDLPRNRVSSVTPKWRGPRNTVGNSFGSLVARIRSKVSPSRRKRRRWPELLFRFRVAQLFRGNDKISFSATLGTVKRSPSPKRHRSREKRRKKTRSSGVEEGFQSAKRARCLLWSVLGNIRWHRKWVSVPTATPRSISLQPVHLHSAVAEIADVYAHEERRRIDYGRVRGSLQLAYSTPPPVPSTENSEPIRSRFFYRGSLRSDAS